MNEQHPSGLTTLEPSEPGALVSEFVLDAAGVIVEVDEAWCRFARANDAPELLEVVGKPLLDFLSGLSLRAVWRDVLARARREPGGIQVSYRCDSPRMQRRFVMGLVPEGDGSLRLTSRVAAVTPSDTGELLARRAARNDALLVVCSWCKAVRVGEDWLPVEQAATRLGLLEAPRVPGISHGMCPDCASGSWREGGR